MVAHPVPIWGKGSHETKSKASSGILDSRNSKNPPCPFRSYLVWIAPYFLIQGLLILDKRPLFGWGDMDINSANKNGNWRNGTKSGDMRHKNCK